MAILACIDRSAYAASVCDHAAWLAGAAERPIDLLQVEEGQPQGPHDLQEARDRLAEHGAAVQTSALRAGSFVETALAATADLLVIGKRGEHSSGKRLSLGSSAAALLTRGRIPTCLVSQLYLPVYRGVVLIDADPDHRRAVEMVAEHGALGHLEFDIILMQPDGADGTAKLDWARKRLEGRSADIFPLSAGTPDMAASHYMESHGVDLIVISREMILDERQGPRVDAASSPLWASRTPVLVC